jgi:hypothetical protein
VKLDIAEDDIPPLIRALEHYPAYLEATKRPEERYLALADELKRKLPAAEVARLGKSVRAGREEIVNLARLPCKVESQSLHFCTFNCGAARLLFMKPLARLARDRARPNSGLW